MTRRIAAPMIPETRVHDFPRYVLIVTSLLAVSGCGRSSSPPPAPSLVDALVAKFKPGRVETVGDMTWSARTIQRVDEFTVAYGDVKASRAQPTGEVADMNCRRMIVRFQPKGLCQVETEGLRVESGRPGDMSSMTSQGRIVFPPTQLPKVAPRP